jgi:hypothetical protein
MDKHARQNWLAQQDALCLKLCGSKAQADKVTADAAEMLQRAAKLPSDRGGDLARNLLKADLFQSAFLRTTLATQLQYWKSYEAAAKRKGIKVP